MLKLPLQDQEKTGEWLRFKCCDSKSFSIWVMLKKSFILISILEMPLCSSSESLWQGAYSRCSLLSIASRDRPVFVYCDLKWSLPPENLSCCSWRWGVNHRCIEHFQWSFSSLFFLPKTTSLVIQHLMNVISCPDAWLSELLKSAWFETKALD